MRTKAQRAAVARLRRRHGDIIRTRTTPERVLVTRKGGSEGWAIARDGRTIPLSPAFGRTPRVQDYHGTGKVKP